MSRIQIASAITILIALLCLILPLGGKSLKKGEKVDVAKIDSSISGPVFINFWASYDASSREENVRFSKIATMAEENGLTMVSFSLDEYESLFREIVRKDGLKYSINIRSDKGWDSDVLKMFGLSQGDFGNYLIDKNGVVIERNLTPKELEKKITEKEF